jgi:uncharacterized protein (DUF2132 family)
MSEKQPADPMHGMTLEKILQALVEHFGWPELGRRIAIRCFNHEPSIKSSLVFYVARRGRAARWKPCLSK